MARKQLRRAIRERHKRSRLIHHNECALQGVDPKSLDWKDREARRHQIYQQLLKEDREQQQEATQGEDAGDAGHDRDYP